MSISPRQIELIRHSFHQVEPIADKAAVIFYNKLFEYAPEVRPLFKRPIPEQGKMLMGALKAAVNGLNDLDKLVPVLQSIAAKHVQYGVKPEHYTPVGNALLYTLKTGLGEQWTPELRQAWVDVYRLMAHTMKRHAYGHI
ncbi:globin family protein [Chitinilyticum piscinae]|uniref:Hemin receptor n=1 Tax=Chitinilyticum piscinae TaxID=2866724 RepID=A0A8J7FPS8_9NEIS|nr:globin family protein [Chitinilyticum piscinae]MBE9609974.1 hemin receptor [Chitinilyticum piscinae]